MNVPIRVVLVLAATVGIVSIRLAIIVPFGCSVSMVLVFVGINMVVVVVATSFVVVSVVVMVVVVPFFPVLGERIRRCHHLAVGDVYRRGPGVVQPVAGFLSSGKGAHNTVRVVSVGMIAMRTQHPRRLVHGKPRVRR